MEVIRHQGVNVVHGGYANYCPVFQENGLSLQVMILQGSYMMVALMEIPSGYIADLFGRKKTLVLGTLFCFLGFALFGFSFGFLEFFIAELLLGVEIAFISGSDSTLFYDSYKSEQSEEYTRIEGKTYSIGNFAEAGAGILGGFFSRNVLALSLVCTSRYCLFSHPFCDFSGRT